MIVLIIVSIAIILFMIIIINIALKREKEIEVKGIETDAIVSKVEYDVEYQRYTAYVKYIGDDEKEHEAIINVATNFPYGRKIRIKFLPGKYSYVIFVSQQLDQNCMEDRNEV